MHYDRNKILCQTEFDVSVNRVCFPVASGILLFSNCIQYNGQQTLPEINVRLD